MLKFSDQILFLMGWGSDCLSELGDLASDPYNYSRILPKGERSVRRLLTRLVKRGLVIKTGKGAKAHYRLSKEGKLMALELRPYFNAKGSGWDGRWRIVVFDIPERYRGIRAVLRRFLRDMGFANFQRSLWINPFDVAREVRMFLKASKLADMAVLMEVDKVWGMNSKELAGKAWCLEELDKKYRLLAKECAGAEKNTVLLKRKCSSLIFNDPFLYKELEGDGFGRGVMLKEFRKLVLRT